MPSPKLIDQDDALKMLGCYPSDGDRTKLYRERAWLAEQIKPVRLPHKQAKKYKESDVLDLSKKEAA